MSLSTAQSKRPVPTLPWGGRSGWPCDYRVLLSAASTMVYPDLMCETIYPEQSSATAFGAEMKHVNGYEFEVMRRSPAGEWLSRRGESAIEVVRRRWQGGSGGSA